MTEPEITHWLRQLPSVDRVLRDPALDELRQRVSQAILTDWVRGEIERLREGFRVRSEPPSSDLHQWIVDQVRANGQRDAALVMQPVINATGIVLHTNLGRAPLCKSAVDRMAQASGYTNVEMNLDTGERSLRGERVIRLLRLVTGAEDAVIVNNCAAATMLVLQTSAAEREVVISRGQLVEIGGGFRLPDVFRAAGVILREVGTTNRTYLADYQSAINAQTGAVLRVHHSNFRMSGFVTEPSIHELVSLQRPSDVAVIDDLGSGWIRNLPELVLNEPSVAESVQAGADLTLFSGDKLFGGPQCGIIVGRSDWITRIRKHPLMRALRIDKLTQAALEATTEIHLSGEAAIHIPCLAMLAASAETIRHRCIRVQQLLGNPPVVKLVCCESQTGGGSVPGEVLPSFGLQISCEHPDAIAEALRRGRPSVQARIQHDSLLLDARTVTDEQCDSLATCLRRSLQKSGLLDSAS